MKQTLEGTMLQLDLPMAPAGQPHLNLSSAVHRPATAPTPPDQDPILEEHRNLMTRGELIYCLRDVHRYWSTPRITDHEMEQLEQQNLIQRSTRGICAIRLTAQGVLVKSCREGLQPNGQQSRARPKSGAKGKMTDG